MRYFTRTEVGYRNDAFVIFDGDVFDLENLDRSHIEIFRLAGSDISHVKDVDVSKLKKIGKLGTSRLVRIVNTLTGQEDTLEVCDEERLEEIATRFRRFNEGSYTWKILKEAKMVLADMTKTLSELGMPNEQHTFDRLDITIQQHHLPTLHLYYNDDLLITT